MENAINADPWTPRQGDQVWVYYFNAQNRDGGVTARVVAQKFEKVVENYLNKLGNVRWILLRNGAPYGQGYGIAHKPAAVFSTEGAAQLALAKAVKNKIDALENALHAALKGGGAA